MDPITYNEIKYFPIPNFYKYYISRCGNVLSCKNKNPKILKSQINTNGYKTHGLKKNNKLLLVINLHRLLAMTFLPDFSPELQVDHKDNNKLNNDLFNLRMVTRRDNQRNKQSFSGVCLRYNTVRDQYNYQSQWVDKNDVQKYKSFSCQLYGFGFALMMAHAKREEMVKLYYNRPD